MLQKLIEEAQRYFKQPFEIKGSGGNIKQYGSNSCSYLCCTKFITLDKNFRLKFCFIKNYSCEYFNIYLEYICKDKKKGKDKDVHLGYYQIVEEEVAIVYPSVESRLYRCLGDKLPRIKPSSYQNRKIEGTLALDYSFPITRQLGFKLGERNFYIKNMQDIFTYFINEKDK